MNNLRFLKALFFWGSMLFLVSCQSAYKNVKADHLDFKEVHDSIPQYLQTTPDEYRLKFGDRLSLVFMPDVKRDLTDSYQLDVGDEVKVSVYDREDLSGFYTIVPDGWLHVPMLKPVKVKGATLFELTQALVDAYKPLIGTVAVNVGINRFNSRVTAFITAISQYNSQGSVYETTIEADGTATFPQIGFIKLSGMTLKEASETIAMMYKNILPNIDITARLLNQRGNVITILGEVRRPGSFEVTGSISLVAALGLAEGWIPSAKTESLIILQQRKGELYLNKFDLEKNLIGATQIQLAAGDMVFVPRTAIADVNVFVDQYLRRNIPINIGVGIPIN